MTLGWRLKVARGLKGLRQFEMAAELGITRGTVSEFENDVRPPKRMAILAWAYVTGVDAAWLEHGGHLDIAAAPAVDSSDGP